LILVSKQKNNQSWPLNDFRKNVKARQRLWSSKLTVSQHEHRLWWGRLELVHLHS
jgi:hypothetical protein